MSTEILITVEDIVGIHDASLSRFGGLRGLRQEGCLDQVLGNAMLAEQYSGNDDGSLGLCFIGSLMYYLVKGQCFTYGNKRTGLGVALKLLSLVGLTLDIDPIALKEYCETIAIDTKITSGDVVRWLLDRLIQIELEDTNEDGSSPVLGD